MKGILNRNNTRHYRFTFRTLTIFSMIFVFLYWLIDLKSKQRWTFFFKPVGSNPLLAYILPFIVYAILGIFGIKFLAEYVNSGMPGILRSLFFSVGMIGFTIVLTRLHIKLHL